MSSEEAQVSTHHSSQPPSTNEEKEQSQQQPQQPNLTEIPITSENSALNVMVMFLNLAQNRGCFRIDESAKIYECIQMFSKNSPVNKSE